MEFTGTKLIDNIITPEYEEFIDQLVYYRMKTHLFYLHDITHVLVGQDQYYPTLDDDMKRMFISHQVILKSPNGCVIHGFTKRQFELCIIEFLEVDLRLVLDCFEFRIEELKANFSRGLFRIVPDAHYCVNCLPNYDGQYKPQYQFRHYLDCCGKDLVK